MLRAFIRSQGRRAVGYAIAAFGIVIGTLLAYGLSIHGQRRKLIGRMARSSGETAKL
jgi:hypothetical protein